VQVEEIIESVDYDGSGDVCFDEFMDIILARDKESGENPIV
jgi:Ca2+-binding EF-hand superfamily protein